MVTSDAPGPVDVHLFGEGNHRRLWDVLGAHLLTGGGCRFSVWAPNATGVRVIGDWNCWSGDDAVLEPVGAAGIWSGVAR